MFSASTSSGVTHSEEPSARWLRLVRGSAAEPDRMVRELAGAAAFSVGSDASCDWQIEAAGVPALALWIRALPGSLFVRAAGSGGVSLDGQSLGTLWTPVAPGSCVSVGAAAFEVGLSGRSRSAQSERLQRVCQRIPDEFEAPLAPSSAREPPLNAPWFGGDGPWPVPTATIFEANDVQADDGTLSRLDLSWAGKLRVATNVCIAVGLLAGAYRCWVLLLDRL